MNPLAGAKIVELTIDIADPANPEIVRQHAALPETILEAVSNQITGERLIDILARMGGDISQINTSHVANIHIHVTPEQKAEWDAAVQRSRETLALAQENAGRATDMDGRITQLEGGLRSGITTNPFVVSFGGLEGIEIIRGVWNAVQHRVEC
jgi:hypothetical protein